MRKLKPGATFENPSYSEVQSRRPLLNVAHAQQVLVLLLTLLALCVALQMRDEKPGGSGGSSGGGASSAPEPSPFVPAPRSHRRERPSAFSPTEDTFKDTANLVKEDSDV